MNGGEYCDRCGRLLTTGGGLGHDTCRAARELEPPRYCARCGRRMVVQVTPGGWSSRCARHGLTVSTGAGQPGHTLSSAEG
jgi:hypothetical protein